jgi:phospholipase C
LTVVGAFVVGSSPRRASADAPLFADGFESGSMASWKTAKGIVLEHTTVHAGTWAASIASTGGGKTFATASLPASAPELYVTAWVDVQSISTTVVLLRMRSPTGTPLAWVGLQKTGRLFTNVSGGKQTVSTTGVPNGGWHLLQFHLALTSGTDAMDVSLDGAPVGKLSTTPSLSASTIGRFDIGETATNRRYALVFDDVAAFPPQGAQTTPQPPSLVTVTAVPGGQEQLSWDPPAGAGIAGYTIYRWEDPDWTAVGSVTGDRFVDEGLAPSTRYSYEVDTVMTSGDRSAPSAPVDGVTLAADAPPISHVVIIDMENHSFDNVLGALCEQVADGTIVGRQPCDGVTSGTLSGGTTVPLSRAPDIVPIIDHNVAAQRRAIDGGLMDGFDTQKGCTTAEHSCLSRYDPSQIPNLAALAETYAISDRTFELSSSPSWVGHMVLAAGTQDGFDGNNPTPSTYTTLKGPGWGCDSYNDASWWDGTEYIMVPSCIPDRTGAGPYRTSPVPYVPTIFDRMQDAGLSWRLYGGSGGTEAGGGYVWAICPTFYECLSSQRTNWVPMPNVTADGQAGTLPNFSIVIPTGKVSQHNKDSMTLGDNWIGSIVSAIQSGPDWPNTAIFITYDDCGCFYDHVAPPQAGWGIRVPMLIVSPHALPGGTDSGPATYASLLAFTEHLFGVPALADADTNAYDYAGSFDYGAAPSLAPVHMVRRAIPAAERAWIAAHPADEDDPT